MLIYPGESALSNLFDNLVQNVHPIRPQLFIKRWITLSTG